MQIYKDYAETRDNAHELRAQYIGSLLDRGWNALSGWFRSAGKIALRPGTGQGHDSSAGGLPAS